MDIKNIDDKLTVDDVVMTSWDQANSCRINTEPNNSLSKEDIHKQICNYLHDLYINKNHDYGDSVHDTYKKFGLVSFLVRISDKLNRLTTLCKDPNNIKITDEKIEDTLYDLANYAILALIELKLEQGE